jgi:broad specificity phosphatase PhoE
MKGTLSKVFLVRHGETAWSSSRHTTGRTDIPLTNRGEQDAQKRGTQLHGVNFAQVLTSPLQRARQTSALRAAASRRFSPTLRPVRCWVRLDAILLLNAIEHTIHIGTTPRTSVKALLL